MSADVLVASEPLPRGSIVTPCPDCDGAGEFSCAECGGRGRKHRVCDMGHTHTEECSACGGDCWHACLRCLGLGCVAAARARALRMFAMPAYVQRAITSIALDLDALGLPVVDASLSDTAVTYSVTVEIRRGLWAAHGGATRQVFAAASPRSAREGYETLRWETRIGTDDGDAKEAAL